MSGELNQVMIPPLGKATVYTQVSRSPLTPLEKGEIGLQVPLVKGDLERLFPEKLTNTIKFISRSLFHPAIINPSSCLTF
jgi:hypothetical protein